MFGLFEKKLKWETIYKKTKAEFLGEWFYEYTETEYKICGNAVRSICGYDYEYLDDARVKIIKEKIKQGILFRGDDKDEL